MRCALSLAAVIVAALSACMTADAAIAYKCKRADGSVSFQDTPCAPTDHRERIRLADEVPAPAVPTQDAEAPAPSPQAAPRAAAPTAVAPRPRVFLCTRYDGSRYLSDTGFGRRTAVPYAMLGDSGRGLAEAYGGREGIGVSAPGLRTAPTIPAARAPLAGAYVWVDDPCRPVDDAEACAFLAGELERVSAKLKHAFSDTQPSLEDEAAALRGRMKACR